MTINTKAKKLYSEDGSEELVELDDSFTPQKVEFMKAGGSYAIVFGKKLQSFACETLRGLQSAFALSGEITHAGESQRLKNSSRQCAASPLRPFPGAPDGATKSILSAARHDRLMTS